MSDLISRQAAIDYVDDVPYIKEHPNIGLLWKAWLEQLPPAQPKKRTEERTETHECDYVSRQDAIRIVDSIDTWQAGWRGNAIESLKAMPSAQPEIVRCKDCRYWDAHDKRCVYLNHGFAPNMWCCHGRRADE